MTDKTATTNISMTITVPLCVDLDGTLIHTDVLLESICALLKWNFFYLFLLPVWLLKGKAHFKQQIADRVNLDVTLLPFNNPLLEYLRIQKQQNRTLVLATASNVKYAEQIAGYLGVFDKVLASDANTNLSGRRKRRRLIDTFGERGFDYAGNAKIDLEIWSHARRGILVNPDPGVKQKAAKLVEIEHIFDNRKLRLRTYLKAIRIHQWLKNILVFVPLAMAHKANDPKLLMQEVLAFIAFGLCASSVYLLNDLLDLSADRRHASKRNRPLAAGTLPIKQGIFLIPGLLFPALVIALWLPAEFQASLALYYGVTLAYSFKLKQTLLLDVLVLAGLYTVRLIAGAAAVSVTPSFWLLAFSMFFFLSLALVKRYSELLTLEKENRGTLHGRRYQLVDIESLAQFGAASGYQAVLVLALYIDSTQIKSLYSHPEAIWLLCPLLLYWISRVWLLARRGEMHEDPIVFSIEDRRSHWLGLVMILILWWAV